MSEDEYFRILKDHDTKVISKDIALLLPLLNLRGLFRRHVSLSLSLSLSHLYVCYIYTHLYIHFASVTLLERTLCMQMTVLFAHKTYIVVDKLVCGALLATLTYYYTTCGRSA